MTTLAKIRMTGNFRIVMDACVMANYTLCDLLLRLADPPRLHSPHFSDKILAETRNTQLRLKKNPWTPELCEKFRDTLVEKFPELLIQGSEPLEQVCQNDPKDRHVLAAAIKANIQTIVTFNLKDFPEEALKPWEIKAVHPSDYLISLYNIDSGLVVAKLSEMAAKRQIDTEELLRRMGKCSGEFAGYVGSKLGYDV